MSHISYEFSVLLYGVESWIQNYVITLTVEAFKLWSYRRVLIIQWTVRITIIKVLRTMNRNTELVYNNIKLRKLQYLGHIISNESRYSIFQSILRGEILLFG